jgi:hypothetical protein
LEKILEMRQAIYDEFQCRFDHHKQSLSASDFAAYYTSMYLISDTGEAIWSHRENDFSSDSARAYIEIWGVLQGLSIQQDAICELHRAITKSKANLHLAFCWMELRKLRHTCAGHPAKQTHGVPDTRRTFLARGFGTYRRFTFETYDAKEDKRIHSFISLDKLLDHYDEEAAAILHSVLQYLEEQG